MLRRALRGPTRYVAQALARIPSDRWPMLEEGHARWIERRMVSGFFFNSFGIGLIGRFSGERVVNVSRGGGIIPALWVH